MLKDIIAAHGEENIKIILSMFCFKILISVSRLSESDQILFSGPGAAAESVVREE